MSSGVGIEVHRASVHTFTLSVQVMKLDKRQVTLSIFRQLDKATLVDEETGALAGIPWGRVNYHPDCTTGSTHLHVVWQKGDRLFRATVNERWPLYSSAPSDLKEVEAQIADRALLLWILSDGPLDLPHDTRKAFEEAAAAAVFHFPDDNWNIPLAGALQRADKAYDALGTRKLWHELHGRYEDRLRDREHAKKVLAETPDNQHYKDILAKPLPDPIRLRAEGLVNLRKELDLERLTTNMRGDLAGLPSLRELAANGAGRWAATYAKLAAMDQLFIAA